MYRYYVNMHAQDNGDHEVHQEGCSWMPHIENRLYLGMFTTCFGAVSEAKKHYKQSNGCAYCCPTCNTD